MKERITIILLFGVALVQALPPSKSVRKITELKDWSPEKKLSEKSGNDSFDDIKQGNRTKKSVICIDVQPPKFEGCPPGCGDDIPPQEGPSMTWPSPDGDNEFSGNRLAPPSFSYQPAPQAPVMRPQPPQIVHQPAPQAPVIRPQPPQFSYQPAPQAPVMKPQRPLIAYQPAPQAPVMSAPTQQISYQSAPQAPVMNAPTQQINCQPASQVPVMLPKFPVLLPPPPPPPPPPPQITLPAMKTPQLAAPIPHLPPCPPEEQYFIPGEDSHEIISYELVPISRRIPSSPGRVVTTEKPPYPCLPPGAPQSLPPQQSPASLTTVQQQSTVNQVQVLQANAPGIKPSYQLSDSPQNAQGSGNIHMMQLPSQNQGYSVVSGPPQMNDGGYAASAQPQPVGGFTVAQPAVNQQPMMIYNGQTVDCADAYPVQSGTYGYQSSQSVAQSFAAAQSAAYSGFGLASFRSAEDDNGAANSTIPQLYSARSPYNHAPSARFSSHGNYHAKRDVPNKGTEKKVKA